MADVMILDECYGNGLRPKRDMGRDPRYVKEMLNMIPLGTRHARTLRQVTWPMDTALSMSFPFPQVLRDDRTILLFEEDAVSSVSTSAYPWTPTEQTVYSALEACANRRFDTDDDWTLGSGWSIANGLLTATGGISTSATSDTAITAVAHLVTFTISGYAAGSVAAKLGTTAGASRSANGTFTEVITSNGTEFAFEATGFTGSINDVSIVPVAAIAPGGGQWQMVAFQDNVWLATNGVTVLTRFPHNPVNVAGAHVIQRTTDLAITSLCKHNNALVIGGMSGSRLSNSVVTSLFSHWRSTQTQNQLTSEDDALDSSYIMYAEPSFTENDLPGHLFMAALGYPGAYEASLYQGMVYGLVERKKIGFFRPRYCGPIQHLRQVGPYLICYGTNGISLLNRTENGYEETVLLDQGIPGRGCVAGDEKQHLFLGNRFDLWKIDAQGGLERLDFSEYMEVFTTPSACVMTYDPVRGQYWISDGVNCFTHTGYGLGQSDAVQPSSILRFSSDDVLFGTAITKGDPQAARIVGPIIDQPNKQTFEVSSLDVAAIESDSSSWTATVDWRLRQSDKFRRPSYTDVSDRGRCFVKKTGVDFRAVLYAPNYKEVDLDRVLVYPSIGKPSLANIFAGTDTILNETNW